MRLFASFLFLLVPFAVQAHGFGFSHETTVDEYQVDIGYSSAAPTPDEVVAFDFNLPVVHSDVPYTNVWVRISADTGAVVFASGIYNTTFGGPRMSYVFPDDGLYTIYVRYEDDSTILLETEFPITVVPVASDTGPLSPWMLFGGGLLLGAGAMFFLWKMRKGKGSATLAA